MVVAVSDQMKATERRSDLIEVVRGEEACEQDIQKATRALSRRMLEHEAAQEEWNRRASELQVDLDDDSLYDEQRKAAAASSRMGAATRRLTRLTEDHAAHAHVDFVPGPTSEQLRDGPISYFDAAGREQYVEMAEIKLQPEGRALCPKCRSETVEVLYLVLDSCETFASEARRKARHDYAVINARNRDRFEHWLDLMRERRFRYVVRSLGKRPTAGALVHTIDCPVLLQIQKSEAYVATFDLPPGYRWCGTCGNQTE
jgi:hypothetical protein